MSSTELDQLQLATAETPFFSLADLETKAKCVKCYDGDTVHLVFIHNQKPWKWSCRLAGIDTPEMRTKNPEEKKEAIEAKVFLANHILDKIVNVKVHHPDKYGRLLVTIKNDQDHNINQLMIDNGHAREYHGGKKQPFIAKIKEKIN